MAPARHKRIGALPMVRRGGLVPASSNRKKITDA